MTSDLCVASHADYSAERICKELRGEAELHKSKCVRVTCVAINARQMLYRSCLMRMQNGFSSKDIGAVSVT